MMLLPGRAIAQVSKLLGLGSTLPPKAGALSPFLPFQFPPSPFQDLWFHYPFGSSLLCQLASSLFSSSPLLEVVLALSPVAFA